MAVERAQRDADGRVGLEGAVVHAEAELDRAALDGVGRRDRLREPCHGAEA
jgi:hypothetical protein